MNFVRLAGIGLKKRVYLFILFAMLFKITLAVPVTMHFKHFTREQGLPTNSVSSIIQDKEGFMWFGTSEGLSRFDGYSFINFKISPHDTALKKNNVITCLEKGDGDFFWIGTTNGLYYFDLSTYEFSPSPQILDDKLANNYIKILKSHRNHLLIVTKNDALFVFDKDSEELKHYKQDPNDSTTILSDDVTDIVIDRHGKIWLGTFLGLEMFDIENESFKHYFKKANRRAECLLLDIDGQVMWSDMKNRKWYHNSTSGFIKEPGSLPLIDMRNRASSLLDKRGNKWISFQDRGIYFEDALGNNQLLQSNSEKPDGINSNRIIQFFEDKDGNIWIANYDGGVSFFDVHRKPFNHIKASQSIMGLQNNRVRAVYQDTEGDIWIGTKMGGMLSHFLPSTNSFVHYKNEPGNSNTLSGDFVLSIVEEKPGILWVGTLHEGLNIFNKREQKFQPAEDRFDNTSVLNNAVYTFCKDGNGDIWMGTLSHGINVYQQQSGTIKTYFSSSSPQSLSSNQVRTIYEGQAGDIWIGTVTGLNFFNRKNDDFVRIQDGNGLQQEIVSICEDAEGRLWVGTNNGLRLLNKEEFKYEAFSSEEFFSNKTISGILEDGLGNLWISTFDGLFRFNPESQDISTYLKEEGLQNNEFAKYVYFKTKEGRMFFGGNNGFNYFLPVLVVKHEESPEIVLLDFKIFNKSVRIQDEESPLTKHIWETDEITLDYHQNAITFSYATLNYSSPSRNQYARKLEGYENEWVYEGGKKEVTYTNLYPGKYVFKVKAANDNGKWTENSKTLSVNILPPPWKTWWAYCCYISIVAGLLWLYRRLTLKKLQFQKEQELDREKLEFFINVSHEFRTPISLILNPAKKLMRENDPQSSHELLSSIYQSAHRMSNLVNQLLDFRKLEYGKMPLMVSKFDIIAFSKNIAMSFKDLAEGQNLELVFESASPSLDAWMDSDKYEKILNNLLSNAIKFSSQKGVVKISVDVKSVPAWRADSLFAKKPLEEPFLELRVRDQGIGISEKQLNRIFDRFQSTKKYTGGVRNRS